MAARTMQHAYGMGDTAKATTTRRQAHVSIQTPPCTCGMAGGACSHRLNLLLPLLHVFSKRVHRKANVLQQRHCLSVLLLGSCRCSFPLGLDKRRERWALRVVHAAAVAQSIHKHHSSPSTNTPRRTSARCACSNAAASSSAARAAAGTPSASSCAARPSSTPKGLRRARAASSVARRARVASTCAGTAAICCSCGVAWACSGALGWAAQWQGVAAVRDRQTAVNIATVVPRQRRQAGTTRNHTHHRKQRDMLGARKKPTATKQQRRRQVLPVRVQ